MAKLLLLVVVVVALIATVAAVELPDCLNCEICVNKVPIRPDCNLPISATSQYDVCPAPKRLICPCIPDISKVGAVDMRTGQATRDITIGADGAITATGAGGPLGGPIILFEFATGLVLGVVDENNHSKVACDPFGQVDSTDRGATKTVSKVVGLCNKVVVNLPTNLIPPSGLFPVPPNGAVIFFPMKLTYFPSN